MKIAIIGPSHARQFHQAVNRGELTVAPETYIRGFQSAPVFVEPILHAVRRCKHYDMIFLYVAGSLRFNFLHSKLESRHLVSTETYYQTIRKNPFLFDRNLLKDPEVATRMDNHLQNWLDHYTTEFSQVRFVFWCEYISSWRKESKKRSSSGVCRRQYSDWTKANSNHVDLDAFVENSGHTLTGLLQKQDVHKNAIGRKLFLKYLRRYAKSNNRS